MYLHISISCKFPEWPTINAEVKKGSDMEFTTQTTVAF